MKRPQIQSHLEMFGEETTKTGLNVSAVMKSVGFLHKWLLSNVIYAASAIKKSQVTLNINIFDEYSQLLFNLCDKNR